MLIALCNNVVLLDSIFISKYRQCFISSIDELSYIFDTVNFSDVVVLYGLEKIFEQFVDTVKTTKSFVEIGKVAGVCCQFIQQLQDICLKYNIVIFVFENDMTSVVYSKLRYMMDVIITQKDGQIVIEKSRMKLEQSGTIAGILKQCIKYAKQ